MMHGPININELTFYNLYPDDPAFIHFNVIFDNHCVHRGQPLISRNGVLEVQPLISRRGVANFKHQEGHTIR